MSKKLVWVVDASLKAGSGTRQVVILTYATDREDFIRQVEAHFARTGDQGQFLLAPLDASTYFERHGKVWLLYHIKSLGNAVKIVPLDDTAQQITREPENHLLAHTLAITPLDAQLGRHPTRFAPDNLFSLLWPQEAIPANRFDPDWQHWQPPTFDPPESDPKMSAKDRQIFGDPLPVLHVYFLADSARCFNFPVTNDSEYRCECLYLGQLAEKYEAVAPYLLEIIPGQTNPLRALFSQKGAIPQAASWDDETGIIIHSRQPFAKVINHLRKFSFIKDEAGVWRFFRFYDPQTLRHYLSSIATEADKLAHFFGAEERIIHAFGSGRGEDFIYYQLKDLSAKPIPIVMSDREQDGMKEVRWRESQEEILQHLRAHHTDLLTEADDDRLRETMEQGLQSGYDSQISVMQYVVCAFAAARAGQDFTRIEPQITAQYTTGDEKGNRLWEVFMEHHTQGNR